MTTRRKSPTGAAEGNGSTPQEEAREKSLRQASRKRLQLARRMEGIGILAGGMAHDFNNVLTVIKAHLDLLAISSHNPEQTAKIMRNLRKAVDHGSSLTKELLIIGRQTEAQPAFVNVTERVRESASILKEALPGNVVLSLQLDESLPPLFIDPGHLDRILTNLIINASDAMPDGGTITISAEEINFAQSPAIPRFEQDDGIPRFCLKISDTGHGMDEATRRQVFEPFYTTKANGKGTGLGLSVVLGLMQVHNGSVGLESEVGKGTTVSLFFPLHHDSPFASEAFLKSGDLHCVDDQTREEETQYQV
jgi:signal transduction histidine kinase